MMRERYSCRKSIWRWLIMVIPPPAGKARGDLGWLIYHTSITLRSPCSIDPAAGGSRHSADNARHDRVLGGRFRLARKNELATIDHVEPVGEIRHVMDVGLGNEQCMAEGADAGESLDDRRHDHRREPFGGLIQQEQFWAERERARSTPSCARRRTARVRRARGSARARGTHGKPPRSSLRPVPPSGAPKSARRCFPQPSAPRIPRSPPARRRRRGARSGKAAAP